MNLSNQKQMSAFQGVINTLLHSSNDNSSIHYVQDVNYIDIWELEKTVDLHSWRDWFHGNSAISVYMSLAYLASVFGGQYLMKNKKPFVLREPLVVWNLLLAAFSAIGFIRTVPELIHILKQENGFHSSVCGKEYHNMATAFWWLLITLSKVVELGDTYFSILRKKPVTFLAWSHHSSALMIAFLSYSAQSTACRWFLIMNFFVHSIMYPYFALKTLNFRFPKFVPMTITFFQLLQMVIGFVVATYSLYAKVNSMDCFVPTFHIYASPLVYAWFVGLFGNLFYNSYIKKKSVKLN